MTYFKQNVYKNDVLFLNNFFFCLFRELATVKEETSEMEAANEIKKNEISAMNSEIKNLKRDINELEVRVWLYLKYISWNVYSIRYLVNMYLPLYCYLKVNNLSFKIS